MVRSGHAKARKTPQNCWKSEETENSQRKAYLTAFKNSPARISQRVIDNKPLIDEESFPEGTFEFWKERFETKSKPYLDSRQRGQLNMISGLTLTFRIKEVSVFLGRMKYGAPGLDRPRK